MSTKTIVLITGGNTGLGFEIIRAIYGSEKAYTILLGGRSFEKAQAAVQQIETEFPSSLSTLSAVQIDLEHDESITRCFEEVSSKYGKLDALINNAGASFDSEFSAGKIGMREMWNKSWNLNTTGTQIVTYSFIPLLLKSTDPRVLFITSGTSTLKGAEEAALPIDKAAAKGWPKRGFQIPAYRSTKTGLNMMMREWHRMLREDGVKVFCVSPGFLVTGLGGTPRDVQKKMGAEDPALGGNFVKDVLEGKCDSDVGKVVRRGGVQPW